MKKENIQLILALIILALVVIFFLRGDEDTWSCKDGKWIKHGNPSRPAPQVECK